MDTNQRIEVYFSGRVQGVGFRYLTRQIAQPFELTGFVRNLDDGRVQVVAEGQRAVLSEFLAEIERQLARYIRHKSVAWSEAEGQLTGFSIRA